ncbi:MAG: hypothetical protein IPO31_27340 [Candidatus Obscuribacter sp.]|nr:hypothetical protein [Candidatus Obscuribacter sp.]
MATGTAAGAVPGVPVTTTTTTTNTVIDKIESRLGINLPEGPMLQPLLHCPAPHCPAPYCPVPVCLV